ncbi:MAG: heme NO-binding domain-containing protein [Myxococcota bacterium]
MRGFIYTELIELIEHVHGEAFVDRWLDESDLPSGGAYTAVATYPTSELVELVSRLSALSGTPVPDLLRLYGEHLFDYLADSHAALVEGFDDAFAFLEKLEQHVHAEVRKLYPDAEVPHFAIERPGHDRLVLTYRSSRAIPDLAHGLLLGAAKRFSQCIEIERETLVEDGSCVRFRMRRDSSSQ